MESGCERVKKLKERVMRTYALSEQGAADFFKAVLACALSDIVLMFPVGVLFLLSSDCMSGTIPASHFPLYLAGSAVCLLLIFLTAFRQYNATFFSTYKESGVRRIALSEKLRKLPLSFFAKKDLSDLTAAILGDCEAIEHAFSHQMPQFWGAMISTCFVALMLLVYDWRMGLAALWPLPVSLFIVGSSKEAQNRIGRKQNEAKLDLADGIQEYLECFRDLKSANAQREYLDALTSKARLVEKRSLDSELKTALYVVSAQMLLKFGIATTALAGSSLLIRGELDALTFFGFLIAVSRIYEPMSGNLVNLAAVNALQINMNRMEEINGQKEQGGTMEFHPDGYDITFDNVRFAYDSGETVLDGVSFTAKQGEVTALVGPSGGGKTTVSRLAARFWDADGGTVRIGGVDASMVDPEVLLSAYSIVFQDVTLFNQTVMENIRLGRKGATDEEVLEAARLANVAEFAEKLPEGWDTLIGENGCQLSGGERQRISIARAFLKDAPVILLDEATASLDAENETSVQTALSRLIARKTVLIIAHRLRTVSGADKIIVLSGGRTAESGTPQELEARDGIFSRMARIQREAESWSLARDVPPGESDGIAD